MKPYSTLYRRWIGAPGVGAAEIAVLSGLYARADADGVCAELVQDELAAELGKSRPWLSAVLTKLQTPDVALVDARRKRGFRGMIYALVGAQDAGARHVVVPDSSGHPADGWSQPADGLLRTGNPLGSDSQTSSSNRAGGAGGMKTGKNRSAIRAVTEASTEPLAEDWRPTAEDLAWAAETRPDVDPATVSRKFVAWCRKAHARNGYRPADPSSAWRRWVARELVAPADVPERPESDRSAGQPPASAVVPLPTFAFAATVSTARRPSNRSDQNDRRPRDLSKQPGSDRRGPDLASRNADVLAALRDRLARPA